MSNGAQIFILMVFATVVLLMQGLVVPVFGESAKTRKRLKKRIEDIEAAGFAISKLETMYLPNTPKIAGFNYWGSASVA